MTFSADPEITPPENQMLKEKTIQKKTLKPKVPKTNILETSEMAKRNETIGILNSRTPLQNRGNVKNWRSFIRQQSTK